MVFSTPFTVTFNTRHGLCSLRISRKTASIMRTFNRNCAHLSRGWDAIQTVYQPPGPPLPVSLASIERRKLSSSLMLFRLMPSLIASSRQPHRGSVLGAP